MTFIQMPNGERYQLVRSGLYDPLGPHQTGMRGWRMQHPWIDRLDLPHLVRLWQQLYGLSQTSLATPKQMRKQIATDLSTGQLQLVSHTAPSDSMEAAENAKKQALNTISQHMRSIIDDEKRQAAEIAKKYEAQGTLGKAVDQGVALGAGVIKAGFDFAKWVKDGHDLINPATRTQNMATAIYAGVQAGSAKVMVERLQAEEKRELVEFMGFDPTKITAEQREAAKDVAALLYDDADTRQLFIQFFKDYASAQHSTEIVEVSGGLLFEVLMDLAIAAVTLGLGTPVLLAKKTYWIQKFNKVLDAIKELIVALKKMALNIKRRVVKSSSNLTASSSAPISKHDMVDQTMHEAGTGGGGKDEGWGGATNSELLIKGAAFRHHTKWAPNATGARSVDEALQLADDYGVYVADDVKINFIDDALYERRFGEFGDSYASYGHIRTANLDQQVTFKGALADRDGKINVYVRNSIRDSDEAIVAVLHHETHEIEALREIFAKRVSLSAREYRSLINDSTPGNIHWQAVDIGDQSVWQLRQDRGL